MYRETILESVLITSLLFNTVFTMPENASLPGQIFSVGVVFYLAFTALLEARKLEKKIAKAIKNRRN